MREGKKEISTLKTISQELHSNHSYWNEITQTGGQ